MSSQSAVHVVSTFDCTSLQGPLAEALGRQGLEVGVSVAAPGWFDSVAPTPSSAPGDVAATVVLVRLEDWLRPRLAELPASGLDAVVRQVVRQHTDDFLRQINGITQGERPVFVILCPSAGWIAEQFKLTTLFRTLGNLFVVRVKNGSTAAVVPTPAELADAACWDAASDSLGQSPLTNQGALILSALIAKHLKESPSLPQARPAAGDDGAPALASFLSGLKVDVRISRATKDDAYEVGKILRSAAAFSLTGENPTLDDAEAVAIAGSDRCFLVRVSDRLGDYGVAGVLAAHADEASLVVNLMSLSCTVLGKQVEHALMVAAADLAKQRNLERVAFEFTDSGRNQSTRTFLETLTGSASGPRFELATQKLLSQVQEIAVSPGAWSVRVE